MKNKSFAKKLALLVCAVGTAIAATSTSMCYFWLFNECKMPKSLYKAD